MKEALVYLGLLFILDKAFLSPSFVERKIEQTFVSFVGEVGAIKVNVDLSPFPRDLAGRIKRVEVSMDDFQTETIPILITPKKVVGGKVKELYFRGTNVKYKDILLKEISLKIWGLKFDLPKLLFSRRMQFVGADKGEVNLVLDEKALSEVGKGKTEIHFLEDRISVKLSYGISPLSVPIEISGKPVVKEKSKIFLSDVSGKVFSLPIPGGVLETIMERIGPMLDIAQIVPFSLPIEIKDIRIEQGEMRIYCLVDLKHLGKTPQGEGR